MDLGHKMVSLLFNILSRFVIAFLPRIKHLLISRLQSPSAVILEPKKYNLTASTLVSVPRSGKVLIQACFLLVISFVLTLDQTLLSMQNEANVSALGELTVQQRGNEGPGRYYGGLYG